MNSIQVLTVLQARFGSADWNQWHIYRQPMYDYVRYNDAGVTSQSFFSVPLGNTDPVSALPKTLEQTNMNKPGSIGQNYFIAQEIRCDARLLPKGRQASALSSDTDLLSTTITNAASKFTELLRRGVLTWVIGDKTFQVIQRPFVECPPGFGVDHIHHAYRMLAGVIGEPTIFVTANPHRKNVWALTPPQLIEPEQTFTMRIDYPDGTSPVFTSLVNSADIRLELGILLDGYIARAAQ